MPRASFRFDGDLRYYELTGGSGNAVRRGFCPICGSPVAGEVTAVPDVIVLYAASLDDPSLDRPVMDIFTASAQPWDCMSPDTEKLTGGMAGA